MKFVFILSYLVRLGRNPTFPPLDFSFSEATIMIGLFGSLFGCICHALNEKAVQISTLPPQLLRVLSQSHPRSSQGTKLAQTSIFQDLGENASSTFLPSINGSAVFYISKQSTARSRLCFTHKLGRANQRTTTPQVTLQGLRRPKLLSDLSLLNTLLPVNIRQDTSASERH